MPRSNKKLKDEDSLEYSMASFEKDLKSLNSLINSYSDGNSKKRNKMRGGGDEDSFEEVMNGGSRRSHKNKSDDSFDDLFDDSFEDMSSNHERERERGRERNNMNERNKERLRKTSAERMKERARNRSLKGKRDYDDDDDDDYDDMFGGRKDKDGNDVPVRTFKIVFIGSKPVKDDGRYTCVRDGGRPKQAAKRAYTKICKRLRDENKSTKVRFVLRETTRGYNRDKEWVYDGVEKKLNKPVQIKRDDGSVYPVEYEREVTRVKKDDRK